MLKNIAEIAQRIKRIVAGELFVVLLIVLIGLMSFGLGRLSALEKGRTHVRIIDPVAQRASVLEQNSNGSTSDTVSSGSFVGSKNGSKYHFPWCSGAQRIKEENKIWFSTKEEAERAGYTPAANCPGL
ncbi:MAG TPA: hypothetical protein VJH21_02365 [Candidatus Paceibacterota bacterium]